MTLRKANSPIVERSKSYNEEEFWPKFYEDLESACAHVVIQSAFITKRRLKLIARYLEVLTGRGIVVCIFLQDPNFAGQGAFERKPDLETAFKQSDFEGACRFLQRLGCHVNLRKNVHQKLAVIDKVVLWEGSLNILSFNRTLEHMRRWRSEGETETILSKYDLFSCLDCTKNRLEYAVSNKDQLNLGRIISAHRQGKTLTLRQLGKLTGVAPARLKQMENGGNHTVNSLLAVTQKLGLELFLVPELYGPSVANFLEHSLHANTMDN